MKYFRCGLAEVPVPVLVIAIVLFLNLIISGNARAGAADPGSAVVSPVESGGSDGVKPTSEADVLRLRILKYRKLSERDPGNRRLRLSYAHALLDSPVTRQRINGAEILLELQPRDNPVRLQFAQDLLDAGDIAKAGREFRRLLRAGFKHKDVLMGLGGVYDRLQKPGEAVSYYRQARALSPRDPEVLEALGDDCGWLGRYNEAFSAYKALLALKPGVDRRTRIRILEKSEKLQAEWAESRSEGEEAGEEEAPLSIKIVNLLSSISTHPDKAILRLELGRLYMEAERPGQAAVEFWRLLSSKEFRYDGLIGLAGACESCGENARARLYLEKASGLDPGRWEAWHGLAEASLSTGDINAARLYYEKALGCECPKNKSLILSARISLAGGRRDEAARIIGTLPGGAAGEAEVLQLRADIALARRDFEKAAECLDKALAKEPGSSWLMCRRAAVASLRGRPVLESSLLAKASKQRPADLEILKKLAKSFERQYKRREAFDAYRAALVLAPEDIDVVRGLRRVLETGPLTVGHRELYLLLREKEARALAADGQHRRAVVMLEKLLSDYARLEEEEERNIFAAKAAGRLGLARGHVERCLSMTRAEIRVRRLLAELYIDVGRDKDVERQYRELLKLDPTQAPYVLRLARLYHSLGLYRRARRRFSAIPPGKLEPQARKERAFSFISGGSPTDGYRQLKRYEKEEAPDDEVFLRLGEWQLQRGNTWRAKRYFLQALDLASANKDAADELRRIYLYENPDVRFHFSSGDDSDGLKWSEQSLEYRCRLWNHRIGVLVGRYSLDDDWGDSSGPQFRLKVGRDWDSRGSWEIELAKDPRHVMGSVDLFARADWHAGDHLELRLSLFSEGMGETSLGAEEEITAKGALLEGELFCSPKWRMRASLERASLSDDNERSRWRFEMELGLPDAVPLSLQAAAYGLDYSESVSPTIYYSPGNALGRELTCRLGLPAHRDLSVDLAYTIGHEDNFRNYRVTEAELNYEVERNRLLNIAFRRKTADRSVRLASGSYSSDELSFGLGVLY